MGTDLPFRDRREAGRELAGLLQHHRGGGTLVLGLPRGGVPVAHEVARALGAQLDVVVVRKLGVPGHAELAMGAIASGGDQVLNDDVVAQLAIPAADIERVAAAERAELARRAQAYRGDRPQPHLAGRTVIVVDDGVATGATMRAALASLRSRGPALLVAAVPVGAPQVCRDLGTRADEVVCARTPEHFGAVGQWYERFEPTSDDEVRQLLHWGRPAPPSQELSP